jgi:hypothetical protein
MKAILEFDLDNRDDRMAHLRCVKSEDMAWVLFEIMSNLRKKVEFEVESFEADSTPSDGVYAAFRRIHELCDSKGIVIDDLID